MNVDDAVRSLRVAVMSLEQARSTLRRSESPCDLLLAIGSISCQPDCTLDDLLLGLQHPGVIAEHAAIALYKRTGRPKPASPLDIVTDHDDSANWLRDHPRPLKEGMAEVQRSDREALA